MTGVKSSGCNMEELQDASQASLEYLGSLHFLQKKQEYQYHQSFDVLTD